MRLSPGRLRYGEEATLVEHLEELRSRLVIALAVGFGIGYAVDARLIHRLELALPPDRRKLITLGVAEPFPTSVQVSLYAGLLLGIARLIFACEVGLPAALKFLFEGSMWAAWLPEHRAVATG